MHPPARTPPLDELLTKAESARGDLRAFRQDAESARFALQAAERSRVPEPEIVAGTKSSSFGGGDVGGVFTVHASRPLAASALCETPDWKRDRGRATIG